MNRWALRLSEYTYDVEHRPGKQNVNVDLFSRQPGISTAGPAIEPLYASIVLNTLQISAPVLAPLYLELVARYNQWTYVCHVSVYRHMSGRLS